MGGWACRCWVWYFSHVVGLALIVSIVPNGLTDCCLSSCELFYHDEKRGGFTVGRCVCSACVGCIHLIVSVC